jgi:hypothetical protein
LNSLEGKARPSTPAFANAMAPAAETPENSRDVGNGHGVVDVMPHADLGLRYLADVRGRGRHLFAREG